MTTAITSKRLYSSNAIFLAHVLFQKKNFYKPRICTETFAYTVIDDWNSLPNNVKGIKSKDKFKDSLKKSLLEAVKKADKSQFVYY